VKVVSSVAHLDAKRDVRYKGVRNEPFTLAPIGIKPRQQVSGVLPVQAVLTGVPPSRVLLYLDGRLITLTLASRAHDGGIVRSRVQVVVANGAVLEAPGSHALTVRAIGADGAVAEHALTVTVAPPSGA
jgi:hypothetical protein